MNQEDKSIKHKEYVDTNKSPFNVRILSINTSILPSNDEKIEIITQKCQEMGIDTMLLNKTNTN